MGYVHNNPGFRPNVQTSIFNQEFLSHLQKTYGNYSSWGGGVDQRDMREAIQIFNQSRFENRAANPNFQPILFNENDWNALDYFSTSPTMNVGNEDIADALRLATTYSQYSNGNVENTILNPNFVNFIGNNWETLKQQESGAFNGDAITDMGMIDIIGRYNQAYDGVNIVPGAGFTDQLSTAKNADGAGGGNISLNDIRSLQFASNYYNWESQGGTQHNLVTLPGGNNAAAGGSSTAEADPNLSGTGADTTAGAAGSTAAGDVAPAPCPAGTGSGNGAAGAGSANGTTGDGVTNGQCQGCQSGNCSQHGTGNGGTTSGQTAGTPSNAYISGVSGDEVKPGQYSTVLSDICNGNITGPKYGENNTIFVHNGTRMDNGNILNGDGVSDVNGDGKVDRDGSHDRLVLNGYEDEWQIAKLKDENGNAYYNLRSDAHNTNLNVRNFETLQFRGDGSTYSATQPNMEDYYRYRTGDKDGNGKIDANAGEGNGKLITVAKDGEGKPQFGRNWSEIHQENGTKPGSYVGEGKAANDTVTKNTPREQAKKAGLDDPQG